jgi:hypothetical protein
MMQKGELREQRFHTGTVELNYAEGPASGEALLYLHGGNGRWQEGRALLEELASAFQVYSLERLRTWSLRARSWSLSLAGLRPRCGDLSGAGREQADRRHWPFHGGACGNHARGVLSSPRASTHCGDSPPLSGHVLPAHARIFQNAFGRAHEPSSSSASHEERATPWPERPARDVPPLGARSVGQPGRGVSLAGKAPGASGPGSPRHRL